MQNVELGAMNQFIALFFLFAKWSIANKQMHSENNSQN